MDASSRIAVKCSECGKFNLTELNFFNIKVPTSIRCECGHRMLRAQVSRKQLILDIDCIACEKQHTYRFKLTELMEKASGILSCPTSGMEIAFLGNDDYINEIVNRSMNELQEIYKSFGFVGNSAQKVVK